MTSIHSQVETIAAALKGAAPSVQVFAELTWLERYDVKGDKPPEASFRCASGVGALIGDGTRWRFFSASQFNLDRLSAWIAHVGGRPQRLDAIHTDEAMPTVDNNPGESVNLDIGAGERFVFERSSTSIAVVADGAVAQLEKRKTDRRRAFSQFAASGRLYEGRSRWHSSPQVSDHARCWSASEALTEARRQARDISDGVKIGTKRTAVLFTEATGAAFLHELIGHGLEADNFASTGRYAEVLKSQVPWLPSGLTVIDDPRALDGFVSMMIDDEGSPVHATTLVADGTVQAQLGSRRLSGEGGVPLARRGRRASYALPALPRASNTVVMNGRTSNEDLLVSDGTGVLVVRAMAGGHVDPATGEYSFSVSQAEFVSPGGSTIPLGAVRLLGNAVEAINEFEAAGRSQVWDSAICGKRGQEIPIGLVSPALRFRSLTWIS